jgi:hypothetical protein
LVREAEDEGGTREFEVSVSGLMNDLLSAANSRDNELVADRLEDIKESLKGPLEGTVDTLFGGSVAKHTYVDGMSDVDSLLILDDSALAEEAPSEAIQRVAEIVRRDLPEGVEVTTGRLAITVEYPDGMQIQLLPALRKDGNLKIPSSRRDDWSRIAPESFQRALSDRNAECGGKLVPTIKLAKAIIGRLPESQRLTGYHVESLAIDVFRNYDGQKTTAAMLPEFFDRGRELVMRPIRDRTGQSIHVDDYLGAEGSSERVNASHVLSRISKRMRNASAHGSLDQWRALFGFDDE